MSRYLRVALYQLKRSGGEKLSLTMFTLTNQPRARILELGTRTRDAQMCAGWRRRPRLALGSGPPPPSPALTAQNHLCAGTSVTGWSGRRSGLELVLMPPSEDTGVGETVHRHALSVRTARRAGGGLCGNNIC